MELQGKVIAVLPERSGVSARGEWKSMFHSTLMLTNIMVVGLTMYVPGM